MAMLVNEGDIVLRALEPEDVKLLYSWENNASIWHVSNTLAPFSKYILTKYIENSHLDIFQTKQLRLIIELHAGATIQPVGAIDLFDFDPFHSRAGLGILIADTENRNKGLGTAALGKIIKYAFNTLMLHQVYCNVTVDNIASLALFRKVGFEVVGVKKDWVKTFDGWLDECLLQLINPNK